MLFAKIKTNIDSKREEVATNSRLSQAPRVRSTALNNLTEYKVVEKL